MLNQKLYLTTIDNNKCQYYYMCCLNCKEKCLKGGEMEKTQYTSAWMLSHYLNLVAKEISLINILNQVVGGQKYF